MTRMNYAEIGVDPADHLHSGSWTGYGIYEAAQLAVPISFLEFSREFEAEADWLGLQYMYKAGYDPQAFIQFFEKIDALEKHKPGTLAKVFADHPQTPDRIARSEEEIATIMPAKPDYIVTTSEFDDMKARLARHREQAQAERQEQRQQADAAPCRRHATTIPTQPRHGQRRRPPDLGGRD